MTNADGADGLYLGLISFTVLETLWVVLEPSFTKGETNSLFAGQGDESFASTDLHANEFFVEPFPLEVEGSVIGSWI